jgi:hypothetical protein
VLDIIPEFGEESVDPLNSWRRTRTEARRSGLTVFLIYGFLHFRVIGYDLAAAVRLYQKVPCSVTAAEKLITDCQYVKNSHLKTAVQPDYEWSVTSEKLQTV